METRITITNAEKLEDHILVTYTVTQGDSDEILATGSEKYSLECNEETIEKHLKRILKTREYESHTDDQESEALDAAAITVRALKDRVITSDDREK